MSTDRQPRVSRTKSRFFKVSISTVRNERLERLWRSLFAREDFRHSCTAQDERKNIFSELETNVARRWTKSVEGNKAEEKVRKTCKLRNFLCELSPRTRHCMELKWGFWPFRHVCLSARGLRIRESLITHNFCAAPSPFISLIASTLCFHAKKPQSLSFAEFSQSPKAFHMTTPLLRAINFFSFLIFAGAFAALSDQVPDVSSQIFAIIDSCRESKNRKNRARKFQSAVTHMPNPKWIMSHRRHQMP